MGRTKREECDPAIEREFLEALLRLEAGSPTHPDLIARAKAHRLKINFSTVAKEAGRARGLIAVEDSQYVNARKQVLAKMRPATPETSSVNVIADLRKRVADLERQLAEADSVNATLMLRVHEVAAELQRAKEHVARLRAARDQLQARKDQKLIQFPGST
ncbi:MAG TPA: hypothetical protein VFV11_05415 [Solimonas sp.]|jgi:chromosome segregation ATPase|nr:hypothetical protein [Solimonas sp.]